MKSRPLVVAVALALATVGVNAGEDDDVDSEPDIDEAVLAENVALTGSLPTEMGTLSLASVIDINQNEVTGTLPTEIGQLRLESFLAWKNRLTDVLPTELSTITTLTALDLKSNQFSGTVPTVLGMLTKLESLELRGNLLRGDIPTEVGHLTALSVFNLEDNRFAGALPTEVGKMTALTDVGWNTVRLSHLPTELGSLSLVNFLSFDSIAHGTLPTELGEMAALTKLLLMGDCNLSGAMPTELARLDLEHLRLGAGVDLCGGITLRISSSRHRARTFEPCPMPPPSPPFPPLPALAHHVYKDTENFNMQRWAATVFLAIAGCVLGVCAVGIVLRVRDSQVRPATSTGYTTTLARKITSQARRIGAQRPATSSTTQRRGDDEEYQVLTDDEYESSSASAVWHEHDQSRPRLGIAPPIEASADSIELGGTAHTTSSRQEDRP